jgi:hypothetical protein
MSKTYSMVYVGTRTQIGEFVGQTPVDVPAKQVVALLAKRGTTRLTAADEAKNTKLYLLADTAAFETAKADGLLGAEEAAAAWVYGEGVPANTPAARRVRKTESAPSEG